MHFETRQMNDLPAKGIRSNRAMQPGAFIFLKQTIRIWTFLSDRKHSAEKEESCA